MKKRISQSEKQIQKTLDSIDGLAHGIRALQSRKDGFENSLTSLGVSGKDRRMSMAAYTKFVTQADAEAAYQMNDISARIIDRPAEDMMREGFKILFESENQKLSDAIINEFELRDLYTKMTECLKLARLYGGSALVMGINDGQTMDQEVNFNRIKSIDYIVPLDRYQLLADSLTISKNIRSPYFRQPTSYTLQDAENTGTSGTETNQTKIHASRLVIFKGVELPYRLQTYVGYYGDSIYSRLWNTLINYETAHNSLAVIVQDFSQMVFKLKDLHRLISADGGESLLTARLSMLKSYMSLINAIVIQEDETIEKQTTNVAGLKDLVNEISNRLVAATDMPHTILLGQSPSGLGATGDSEKRDYYDHISNMQEAILTPKIRQITSMLLPIIGGSSKKNSKHTIEYNPLWQMSDKEAADLRLTQAQVDEKYVDLGVVDPSEVRENRFGSGSYSADTIIEGELDVEIKTAKPDEE